MSDGAAKDEDANVNDQLDAERLREIVIDLELSKEREKELRNLSDSLLEGVRALTSSNKSDELFANLIESLKSVLQFTSALVVTQKSFENSDGEGVPFTTTYTTDERFENCEWIPDKTFTRLLKGKPIVLADLKKVTEWQDKPEVLRASAQSSLYLPIIGEHNRAILMFLNSEKSSFNNTHKALATKLIPLARQALLNAEHTEMIKETLNIVSLKNKEIEAILNNINEGIFVINADKTIAEERSPMFDELVQDANCAVQGYAEVIKALMQDKSVDELDLISTSLSFSLGSDMFQWEMCGSNLPRESVLENAAGQKRLLEWEWAPIEDEEQQVSQVLATIRDVTEIRQLQKEAEHEKEMVDIIYSIISAGLDETQSFLSQARDFIAENRDELNKDVKVTDLDVALLFRNMHTIKGNARVYGYKSICDISHKLEGDYDLLRNGNDQLTAEVLKSGLSELESCLETYQLVIDEKLSSISGGKGRSRSEKFMKDFEQIICSDSNDKTKEITALYNRYTAVDLEALVGKQKDSIKEIAEVLGKPEPELKIASYGILLTPDFARAVADSLTHCFRNSMDHGIESVAERLAAEKVEQGTITVTLALENDSIFLLIFDDGRGLNLTRLAEKVNDETLTDDALAQRIFDSGVSTAQVVSDISGRGVGMDAVKQFMERLGSSMQLELRGDRGETGFVPFAIKIAIPEEYIALDVETLRAQIAQTC